MFEQWSGGRESPTDVGAVSLTGMSPTVAKAIERVQEANLARLVEVRLEQDACYSSSGRGLLSRVSPHVIGLLTC